MKLNVKDQNGVTLHTANKYCEEDIEVRIDTEELNILPSTEEQISEGLYNKVTVPGSPDLLPENIVEGKEIFGKTGTAKAANFAITYANHLFYNGARTEYINEILSLCKDIVSTESMFHYCRNITNLDLSELNTGNVTTMYNMFQSCSKLTELDLSNFNTSNVTNMNNMFQSCELLSELDLSNFDTSNVTDMGSMFSQCSNITKIDVSNFNTSKLKYASQWFNYCKILPELDLTNCDLSNVVNCSRMFNACNQLSNLRSFKNLGKGFTSKSHNYSNYELNLSNCPLTKESLLDIITNGLYDLNITYDVANGGTLYRQSFSIGATNMSKLTEEEIQIAIDKGWNVS